MSPVTALRIVTTGPAPANVVDIAEYLACDNTLCCPCATCEHERAELVRQGVRQIRQPWEPIRRAA